VPAAPNCPPAVKPHDEMEVRRSPALVATSGTVPAPYAVAEYALGVKYRDVFRALAYRKLAAEPAEPSILHRPTPVAGRK
jgi:hypothetical protein